MKSKRQLSIVLAAVAVSALSALPASAQTSRVVPFSNVVTTLPASTAAQALTIQLWDVPTGGAAPLFVENQTLDVDASGNISFMFGAATAGGLDPANFPSASSRYLDVVDSTGTSVLAARLPLNATSFALSPGPPGPAGPKGDKGDPGPPGTVNSVTGGDTSIVVGGTPANPIVSVAPNGINDSKVANGALSPAKVAGTAATLGANTFLGTQTVQTFSDRYGTTHTDGIVTVGSFVGTDTSGPVGGFYGTRSNHPLFFFTNNGFAQMALSTAGNVGIGTTTPGHPLHVRGFGIIETKIQSLNERALLSLDSTIGGVNRTWTLESGVLGTAGLFGIFDRNAFQPRLVINTAGSVGIGTTAPQALLDVAGAIRIGGADFAERFEVIAVDSASGEQHSNKTDPGVVVAIDPKNAGKLIVSHRAYDRRVAGVVSGAGGVNPGMLMGQSGTLADGDQPIALAGRVYCWADASNGPIEPGDLLTTSGTPGHAMKVTDHKKAQGAIIGKALTGLREGRGLILILVTLR